MPLQPQEYDKSYFDGKKARYSHNAGYNQYERWYRKEDSKSLGEFWKDYSNKLLRRHDLADKKALEIGCAKGFVVKDLRDMGVDAYGMDVSQYAIDNCEPEAASYLVVGDARTDLKRYKNKEFDVVYSLRFLECISETDLPDLINEINRITKFQFHVIDERGNQDFYLIKPLEWWINLPFTKNTILISNQNWKKELIK